MCRLFLNEINYSIISLIVNGGKINIFIIKSNFEENNNLLIFP